MITKPDFANLFYLKASQTKLCYIYRLITPKLTRPLHSFPIGHYMIGD